MRLTKSKLESGGPVVSCVYNVCVFFLECFTWLFSMCRILSQLCLSSVSLFFLHYYSIGLCLDLDVMTLVYARTVLTSCLRHQAKKSVRRKAIYSPDVDVGCHLLSAPAPMSISWTHCHWLSFCTPQNWHWLADEWDLFLKARKLPCILAVDIFFTQSRAQ